MEGMIYCQKDIPKDKLRYGFRQSASTGCGWIAAYNALRIMGYKPNAEMTIECFKDQIPLFNGNIGTFIFTPAIFLKQLGFSVNTVVKRNKFDETVKNCDAAILYFWWRRGAKTGAHFVALHHTPKGFVGYNTYNNSKGPDRYGQSLEKFIENKKYFGTILFTINKPYR